MNPPPPVGSSGCCGIAFTDKRCECLFIGAALTAIAAIAAYYCIVNGLPMYDAARTSLSRFGAAFLLYSGASFAFVAAGNALYVGSKFLCVDEEAFAYSSQEKRAQIALSILAPIAVLPGIVVMALGCAIGRR